MTLIIDNVGFVYIDGVRVFRYIPTRQALQFWDRNPQRSARRGDRCVEIDIDKLVKELGQAEVPCLPRHSQGRRGDS